MNAQRDGVRVGIGAGVNADAKLSVGCVHGQRKNAEDEERLDVLHGGPGEVRGQSSASAFNSAAGGGFPIRGAGAGG